MLPGNEGTGTETGVDPAALFELTDSGGDEDTSVMESEVAGTDNGVEAAEVVRTGFDGTATADDVAGVGVALGLPGPGETGQTVV